MKDKEIEEVKEEVKAQISRLKQLDNQEYEVVKIFEMEDNKYEKPKVYEVMSLAMTGNEQGVGVA